MVEDVLHTDTQRNDGLLATLPEESLVINATGMGKDRRGSPFTDAGLFPLHNVALHLNYRGELDFLRQARTLAQRRDVHVHDGWDYFVVSWADHIAEIFHLAIPPTTRTPDGEGGGDAYLIAGSYLPLLPDHFDEEVHTLDNLLEKASILNVRTSHREAGLSPATEPEKLREHLAANSHRSEL